MRLRIFLLLVFLFVLDLHAQTCRTPHVERDNPYAYLLSLTDAMSYARLGLQRVDLLADAATHMDVFIALRLEKADFECAKAQTLPYASSKNEAIAASAKASSFVFTRLADLQDRAIEQYKSTVDAAGKIPPGTLADRQAELAIQFRGAWMMLAKAVIASTYAVIAEDPKTGLMSRLDLTQTQRDEVLKKLHDTFGDQIISGAVEGQHPLTATAATLYQFMADPKRQSR